jgi:peptide/nickel transport system substrate-binding protein
MTVPIGVPTRQRRVRGALGVGAAIVALGLVLVGCASATDPAAPISDGTAPAGPAANVVKESSGPPKMGGTLKVGLEADTDGWDPSKTTWAPSAYIVASSFYDPMVIIDQDLKPKPNLVESITPNSDFTQWDIKTRQGVTFHDGDPLTADWLNQWVGIIRSSVLLGPAARSVASSAVVDAQTVRLTMTAPWSTFPYILAAQAGYVPSPKTAAAQDGEGPRHPVGTGAFVFKEWVTDNHLLVERNAHYWRAGLPYLDAVDFRPISDTQARVASLKTGDVDLEMQSLADPVAQLTAEAESGTIQLVHSKGDQDVNMVLFNIRHPPFDDVRVRQALAYAIDRETLASVTNTAPSEEATSLFDKDSRWYLDTGYYDYQPDKARELIDAYVKEKGPLTFTFGTSADNEVQKSTTAIMQMWEAVGAKVESQNFEQAAFVTNAVTDNFQVQIWRQFGSPDPDSNGTFWRGDNADTPLIKLNMSGNQDPQIDAALQKARTTLDQGVRKQQYDIVQQRFKELVPYIWLSHVSWVMGASNRVRNIEYLELPDGSKSVGLINGTFPVTGIWLDQ